MIATLCWGLDTLYALNILCKCFTPQFCSLAGSAWFAVKSLLYIYISNSLVHIVAQLSLAQCQATFCIITDFFVLRISNSLAIRFHITLNYSIPTMIGAIVFVEWEDVINLFAIIPFNYIYDYVGNLSFLSETLKAFVWFKLKPFSGSYLLILKLVKCRLAWNMKKGKMKTNKADNEI